MATTSFLVHTEKENENPVSIKKPVKGLQAFPNKMGKLSANPTPRKALGSVNQLHPVPHSIKNKELEWSQGPVEALFRSKKAINDENAQNTIFTKKPKMKKSPVVPIGLRKSSACKPLSKPRTPKIKHKPVEEPIPTIPADEDYDSDTLFPRMDRLSNYVEKLLTWRPPCPFSTLPETESDSDIGGLNDSIDEIVLDQIPDSIFDVDNEDIPKDLTDWFSVSPVLSPNFPSPAHVENLDVQSPNTSLHLGGLHFSSPESSLDGDGVQI